jgi:hypothetical protein
MFWSWLSKIRKNSERSSCRPRLEALEGRILPTSTPLTFVVDPSLSSLRLSGSLGSSDLRPQGPESLTATWTGSIAASYDPAHGTLWFDAAGTNLVANNSGEWQPRSNGISGYTPADYGGQFTLPLDALGGGPATGDQPVSSWVTASIAIRKLAINLTTASPLRVDSRGAFASIWTLTSTAGRADYEAGVLGSGMISLAGQSATNRASTLGRITTDTTGSGDYRLSVPIDVTITSDVQGQTVTWHAVGTVVASATVPVVKLSGEAIASNDYITTLPASVDTPVPLADPGATILSQGGQSLTRLSATLTNLPEGSAEFLAADTTGTRLTAGYDPSSGILTIAGPGTLADYQTVLRTVTWTDPAASGLGTRLVTFVATDTAGHSSVASTTTLQSPLLDPLSLTIDPFGFHDYGADTGNPDPNALSSMFRATGSVTGADPNGTILATLTDSDGIGFPDGYTNWTCVLRPLDLLHWYVDIDLSPFTSNSFLPLLLQVTYSYQDQTAGDSLWIQASVLRY